MVIIDSVSAVAVQQKYAPEFDQIIRQQPPLGYLNLNTYISEKFSEIVTKYNEALGRVIAISKLYFIF